MPEPEPAASQPLAATGTPTAAPRGRNRWRPRWLAVAAAMMIVGTGGSVAAAVVVAHNDSANSRRAFRASAAEIASTLQLALQREQDLITSASGFIAGNPSASNARFVRWADSVHAFARYPELTVLGHSVLVPAAALPAFATKAVKDPAGALANGAFRVLPPGRHAYYCLAVGGVFKDAQATLPAGYNFCAEDQAGALAGRDSGQSALVPIRAGGVTLLSISTPVYQNGDVPTSAAGRRHAFLGWVGMSVVPEVILARALSAYPDTAVALHYHAAPMAFRFRAGASNVVFRGGKAPAGAASDTIGVQRGWTVDTFGAVAGAGVFAHWGATALLIGGIGLSALLAAFAFVLGTGRARALRLVNTRTRELASARDDAVNSSNAKSVFVATISHELRTPLSGVIGTTELLMETPLDPEQREYAEIVRSSSEGLLSMINDVLDYSKIEAGKLELDRSSFALSGLIDEARGLLMPIASGKGIGLEFESDSDLPEWLYGDAGRLRQVVINLLSNAVKFTAEGTVTVQASAATTADVARVRVAVSDTGIGVDESTLERLFQPFTQADSSTARQYGGTGLGLTIAAQLIEMMGGRIGAQSTPGDGSTFWFEVTLPLAEPHDRSSDTASEFRALGERTATGELTDAAPLVLVAEDTPVNQMLATRQLDRCGYRAEVVANGREAVEATKRSRYAAVLMDCQMPEMDGYEAAREIRRREIAPAHLAIVATTAHSTSGDREKCLAAGMDDYIAKPIRARDLSDALRRANATPPLPAAKVLEPA